MPIVPCQPGGNADGGTAPILSVIIVSYNTCDLLRQCLETLHRTCPPWACEVLVVDNASADGSAAMVRREFPAVTLTESTTNLGFAGGNNVGIRAARGRYVLLLNSDTLVLPGALERLVRFLDEEPAAAAVGPRLLNADRSLQRSWFDFPSPLATLSHILGTTPLLLPAVKALSRTPLWPRHRRPAFLGDPGTAARPVDYVIFASVLIRREVLDRIGLLDEGLAFYHEDFEFGLRMRRHGLTTYCLPEAEIVHLGGASSRLVVLRVYREYYRSLLRVCGKHLSRGGALSFRAAIFVGFLWRSLAWCVGGYRRVTVPNPYTKGKQGRPEERHPAVEILRTYLRIAADALRGAGSPAGG